MAMIEALKPFIGQHCETTATLMERAGTGGSLFRNLYRDFLSQSHELLGDDVLLEAHARFEIIAEDWKHVADLLDSAGKTGEYRYIEEASGILLKLALDEKLAMEEAAAI